MVSVTSSARKHFDPRMNKPFPEMHSNLVREEELALLAKEARYCSHGDTVHYAEHPKFFERCEGSYLYDLNGQEYLDRQMWYWAVNLGYANPIGTEALRAKMDKLQQLACQYMQG